MQLLDKGKNILWMVGDDRNTENDESFILAIYP